jgi:two-component system sensor histidine kinase/response regulator
MLSTENKQATILIVDDNSVNIKIASFALSKCDCEIVSATSGNEALQLIAEKMPDLVLLDVMMPGMDGFETCRHIKAEKKHENLPVIFITALTETTDLVKGFQAGGVDYVTKPFKKEELISRVQTQLELKRIRDDLHEKNQRLSDLNKLKDKMFSVIGHDLRSPLGSVKLNLEFLSYSAASVGEEFAETISTLTSTTNEVYNLLENLLGWAKSQSGNLAVVPEDISLKEVVESVFLLNKGNFKNKGIEFKQNIDDVRIHADLNSTKVVLRNLLSNALKFTPENGSIELSTKRINGHVQIELKDSGVGIPEENIPKLFDSSQYITTYGTNRESGSGLGLSLCHDYIKKNSGDIWVEREVGQGTSFFFTLPVTKS